MDSYCTSKELDEEETHNQKVDRAAAVAKLKESVSEGAGLNAETAGAKSSCDYYGARFKKLRKTDARDECIKVKDAKVVLAWKGRSNPIEKE